MTHIPHPPSRPLRGVLATVVGLAAALGIGSCAQTGSPTSECTDQTTSAGAPGDAEPMLILGDVASGPTIVYADGAVVVPTSSTTAEAAGAVGLLPVPRMAPGFTGEQPGGFVGGALNDCELAVVVDRADDLFGDVDFGFPSVTDSGSTTVTYRGEEHSIYAYDRSDPGEWGDLSPAENGAREDLADLWDLVQDEAALTGELPIDRLLVRTFGPVADEDLLDWPLDTPLSELLSSDRCATITDPAEIELLLDRLEEGDLVESTPPLLAITAQAPGTPDCP